MKKLLIFLVSCICISIANAQDTTKVVKNDSLSLQKKEKLFQIETIDGNTFIGSIESENATEIVFETKSIGKITIQKSNIKTIKEIETPKIINGQYWFTNPNSTRYVITPSAFNLKKGEGYYQNLYLFVQSFQVGVTDNFSIGGGTEIATILFAQKAPLFFYITPKYTVKVDTNLRLGAGVLYMNVNGGDLTNINNHLGMVYGLGTIGNRDNNFTAGLGWSFIKSNNLNSNNGQRDSDFHLASRPTITLSGMARLTKRFSLITENWIVPFRDEKQVYDPQTNTYSYSQVNNYQYIVSYGMRFMSEKIAVDFGFFNNSFIAENIPIGIPFIDFTINFGGNKKLVK